ncbi:MAG: phosphoenolpyruvate mutase [Bacteriovorax sp.]|nr:phosphoenolpyruvate mutase [Bacteriovorax sp.]
MKKPIIRKTTQLRNMLNSSELEFLMEAHNGMSAKIAEEAGFKGIWGSGLSISAALGVRDNNEASWTQVLEVVEFMSDATTIPILLDGDTGYGNFNNMRRLVTKLEQRGVAGVCIEDKVFPKTNSFLRTEAQPLADMDEFCGKIKAGQDTKLDSDFNIIARVEALIAGWGMGEALKRADAYRLAGANGILMHSKISKPDEILAFMKEWGERSKSCPIVIVPTKYYATPTNAFREANISVCIWANHQMRMAVTAMQNVTKTIFEEQSLMNVEDKIVSVAELFRLQNDKELEAAEKLYLSVADADKPRAIFLAASRGAELKELTEDKPKVLIDINGKPLIEQSINNFYEHNIKDISIVRGYKKEAFKLQNIKYFDNDNFETTSELSSLFLAKKEIVDHTVISYGDILYRKYILSRLLEEKGDITIVVDATIGDRAPSYVGDFVLCSRPHRNVFNEAPAELKGVRFGQAGDNKEVQGEWIGLIKTNKVGSEVLSKTLEELSTTSEFSKLKLPDLMNKLLEKKVRINVMYIDGHWLDIDNYADVSRGQKF